MNMQIEHVIFGCCLGSVVTGDYERCFIVYVVHEISTAFLRVIEVITIKKCCCGPGVGLCDIESYQVI